MSDKLPRFTDNGNGTVTDNKTGLTWLQDADRFGLATWDEAVAQADSLASGTGGLEDGSGAGDWRLPRMDELVTLIDFSFVRPAVSDTGGGGQWRPGNPFVNVNSENLYWSGTPAAQDPKTLAWWVHLGSGNLANDFKTSKYLVWPVRGTSAQSVPRYTGNGDGTVTDHQTGLVWLEDTTRIGQMLWTDAVQAAAEVKSGMYGLSDGSAAGDWRLPTQSELLGLLDYSFVNPAVADAEGTAQWSQGNAFDNVTVANLYWSSTTYADNSEIAWGTLLGTGNASTTLKNGFFFVFPVRKDRQLGQRAGAQKGGTVTAAPSILSGQGGNDSAFIIAHITVKDAQQWSIYAAAAHETLGPFGGEPVFEGQVQVVFEGRLCSQLAMVLKFPNQERLQSWYASPEYQAIIPIRDRGADVEIASYNVIDRQPGSPPPSVPGPGAARGGAAIPGTASSVAAAQGGGLRTLVDSLVRFSWDAPLTTAEQVTKLVSRPVAGTGSQASVERLFRTARETAGALQRRTLGLFWDSLNPRNRGS